MNARVSKRRAQRVRRADSATRPRTGRRSLALWSGVLGLCAVLLIAVAEPMPGASLAVGQKAAVTLLAATDFTCVDLDRTELARRQAAESALPVFAADFMRVQEGVRAFRRFLDRVRNRVEAGSEEDRLREEVEDFAELSGVRFPAEHAIRLAREPEPAGLDTLLETLLGSARRGTLQESDRDTRFQGIAAAGSIWLDRGPEWPPVERRLDDLPSPGEAAQQAAERLSEIEPWNRVPPDVLRNLVEPWLSANLVYQPAVTDQRRREASRAVSPVTMTVRAGATLIEAGEMAAAQTIEMLREHDRRMMEQRPPFRRALILAGDAGIVLLATALVFCLVGLGEGRRAPEPNSRILFAAASILTAAAVRGLLWMSQSGAYVSPASIAFALPVSVSALLVVILDNPKAGILSGAWTALVASIFMGRSFEVLTIGLFSAVVAAVSCRRLRRRGQIFQAGLWIGLTRAGLALLADLPAQQPLGIIGARAGAALGVGLAESALVLLLLPLFEYSLRLTSNIRLLELSDPGHPLLRRMAEEAPGTYHHSLMVAHLAEAAAEHIGANPLLARVCAYFHDIGKLTKPEYFIENAQYQKNPHDDISPAMSNLVIQAHIKEGVSLAQRHRLPPPVLDGIRQHHGTGLISCFYRRAQERAAAAGTRAAGAPAETDYRYGGPRPARRELGILLLADSVEAASRSLQSANPARLRQLVEELVAGKLRDGQLDDAALTLAELSAVKQSFAFTLANMRHGRLAYPSHDPAPAEPSARPADPQNSLPKPGPQPASNGSGRPDRVE